MLPKIVGKSDFFTFNDKTLAKQLRGLHEELPVANKVDTVMKKKISPNSSLDSIVIVSSTK